MAEFYVKKPCKHCPFRRDVRPFLTVPRAEELAYQTQNPYSEFYCHKTLDHDDEEGETIVTRSSQICAGFLSMKINEAGVETPEGFEQSDDVYADAWEMVDAYEMEANGEWSAPR